MLKDTNVAFYAPIKPPDHHIPSGDRLIAQNLFKAFEISGANIELASRYIAYSKRHDVNILEDKKNGALEEIERLLDYYKSMDRTLLPQIWVTYHPYCKAPDWIGPKIAKALDIPYVTIEAARTGQGGAEDLWKPWRKEAQEGIKSADMHLVFKPTDQDYLKNLLGNESKLFHFNPFIDAENIALAAPENLPKNWDKQTPVLITTGMMRKGKKLENFKILAEVLKGVRSDFNLIIVGGGPEEQAVKDAFHFISSERTHWTGLIEHAEVLRWMRSADVFIWPGWNEPIGMVYLEAQLQELPILAFKSMGVPLVVEDKQTGFLSTQDDIAALTKNTDRLLNDVELSKTMGKNGRKKVLSNHGIHAAAQRLEKTLSTLLK